jgi:isopropylmalate/homocitrate/citramalate synthase
MVIEYASIRGSFDGMNPEVITEIARYYKEKLGYNIPPMTPFIGENFNVTRAGIHADGMMKDAEIYNIFDTEKVLGVPAAVSISKTSGTAGIAYWINNHYKLSETEKVSKRDEIVIKMKEYIDELYAEGRVTLMTDTELEELFVSLSAKTEENK